MQSTDLRYSIAVVAYSNVRRRTTPSRGVAFREAERRAMLLHIRDGSSVLLLGASGVGKTRLAAELVRRGGSSRRRGPPARSGRAPEDPHPCARVPEPRRSVVVAVDGIDQLDDGSLGFVRPLVAADCDASWADSAGWRVDYDIAVAALSTLTSAVSMSATP